jgi:hypothetical protein
MINLTTIESWPQHHLPTITTNDKSNYHRIMTTTPPKNTTNDKSNYHRIMTTTPPTYNYNK